MAVPFILFDSVETEKNKYLGGDKRSVQAFNLSKGHELVPFGLLAFHNLPDVAANFSAPSIVHQGINTWIQAGEGCYKRH